MFDRSYLILSFGKPPDTLLDNPAILEVLQNDGIHFRAFRQILASEGDRKAALGLRGDDAQLFLNRFQMVRTRFEFHLVSLTPLRP